MQMINNWRKMLTTGESGSRVHSCILCVLYSCNFCVRLKLFLNKKFLKYCSHNASKIKYIGGWWQSWGPSGPAQRCSFPRVEHSGMFLGDTAMCPLGFVSVSQHRD